jgi:hypothetical protein
MNEFVRIVSVVGSIVLLCLLLAWLVAGCVAAGALAGAYGALTSTVSLAQRNEQLNQGDAHFDELRRISAALERRGMSVSPAPLSASEAARGQELRDREPRRKTFWARLWELI